MEKVNRYGLLYTLKGSDSNLKPAVFMAHQDVVPAANPSKWSHPPFEAFYDGQWLWGRGSVDCKNNLIGLLSTMEHLLSQGFKNKRTFIFSFGFDEETGGERGSRYLAEHLEKKLGKDSVAMILDEGGMGIESVGDVTYAFPAVAEKGYVDIVLTLESPGGHSSRPPSHSAIGIMSEMVTALEDHPFDPFLDKTNPYHGVLQCQAKHSPSNFEPWLKDALLDSNGSSIASRIASSRGDSARFLMQTSQAVDIIHGGVKDNQLPERVETTINYRILPHDKLDDILRQTADLLAPIAHKHSIPVQGFGYSDAPRSTGLLKLSSNQRLEPSALTSTSPDSRIWSLFAGTLVEVLADTTSPKTTTRARTVVPAGTLMTGNTDTKHYWNLSKNIYRFSPRREGTFEGVHTVDERLDMRSHLEGLMVYYKLIRNLDAFEG